MLLISVLINVFFLTKGITQLLLKAKLPVQKESLGLPACHDRTHSTNIGPRRDYQLAMTALTPQTLVHAGITSLP
jgi:hypothetical protein